MSTVMNDLMRSYRNGKIYLDHKTPPGGNRKGVNVSYAFDRKKYKSSFEALADKLGTTPGSLSCDRRFYNSLNALAKDHGDKFRDEVLNGVSGMSRNGIIMFGRASLGQRSKAYKEGWKAVHKLAHEIDGNSRPERSEVPKPTGKSVLHWQAAFAFLEQFEDSLKPLGIGHVLGKYNDATRKALLDEFNKRNQHTKPEGKYESPVAKAIRLESGKRQGNVYGAG